jgi:two-component system sporulation sensor kinase B
MDQIKDIILQLVFLLFPIFLYQAVWLNPTTLSHYRPNRMLITIFCSTATVLCMLFPLDTLDTHYDLRAIPVVVAFLYGGYIPGIITALIQLLFRLFISLDSVYSTLISLSLYSIFPIFLLKKWIGQSYIMKIALSVMIGIITLIAKGIGAWIIYIFTLNESFLKSIQLSQTLIIYTILIVFSFPTIIILIEYVKENALMRSQLLRAEKLNVVSELAASVAHEVRNPLTVVKGFLQLLEEHDPVKNKEYMKIALSELNRAEVIITDYLQLAKVQIENKEGISLSKCLTEVVSIMNTYASIYGVLLITNVEEDVMMTGDYSKIKQVFINLIKNAIEASENPNGTVTVTLVKNKSQISIRIKDTGIGMSPDQIRKLGEPFYTLKERGTGLGLMVSFQIIQSHNGVIHYESERGNGTLVTITFSLPS